MLVADHARMDPRDQREGIDAEQDPIEDMGQVIPVEPQAPDPNTPVKQDGDEDGDDQEDD